MKSIDLKMYLFEKICSTFGWHFSELFTDRKLCKINQNGRNLSLLKLDENCRNIFKIFQTINYILVVENCLNNPCKPQVLKIFEKRNSGVSDNFIYDKERKSRFF